MSIRTNELSLVSSLERTDSVIVNTSSGTQAASIVAMQNAMLDVIHSGGVPYGKELTESWASLQSRIQSGDFTGIRIGDYKTITLTTGEVVVLEVAGIDQYYKCGDQYIGHHIDFISRDCLNTLYQMNTTNINNGTEATPNPWLASALYTSLNGDGGVFSTLPSDLQSVIIEKRLLLEIRYSASATLTAPGGWAWVNAGKLWLPTEVEVFGSNHWSLSGYSTGGGGANKQYPIFIGNSNHLIKGKGNGGSRYWWWLCTPQDSNSTHFCYVGHYGNASPHWATHSGAVPVCCRVG